MRILITGGGGFIGTYLSKYFTSQGHEVGIVDVFKANPVNSSPSVQKVNHHRAELLEGANVYTADACNLSRLLEIGAEFKPTHIVNLASISLAMGAELNADEAVNLSTAAIKNIFSLGKIMNVDRIVHFSSSYVYGNFQAEKCDELHPLNPINVYGRTKQVSEILCKTLSEVFAMRAVIIRPISVYGIGDLNGKISAGNISTWINEKNLRLNGGPDRINTVTHIRDVARALDIVLRSDEACGQVFNLSSDEHLSNADIQSVFESAGYTLALSEPSESILKVPVRGRVSIKKIRALGFNPEERFEAQINEMIRFAMA